MRRYFKLIAILSLLACGPTKVSAQTGLVGFFINGAGFFPQQKNIQTGYGSGMGAVLYISPRFSVSFEWKYGRFRIDRESGKFYDGTLTLTPLVVSLRYDLRRSGSFVPYVFAGGGLYFNSFRLEQQADLQEANVRGQKIKNGIGFYGGVGTMVDLNETLSLFVEGLYLRRTSEVETRHLDDSPAGLFSADLSSLSILLGLNYHH